jgi:hypothetical protein
LANVSVARPFACRVGILRGERDRTIWSHRLLRLVELYEERFDG